MGERLEKKFTWVLKIFSSLEDKICYSLPFVAFGCNWRLVAYPKGDTNKSYLCVCLDLADPASLPRGWSREVRFSFTLVSKGLGKSNIALGGQCCFNEKHRIWGYNEFVSLTKLHAKEEGFLEDDKLIIVAQLHVFPPLVATEEIVKVIESLSSKQGKYQGDSSCQVVQKTENASNENLDDDENASEEGSDDDTSDEGKDDDGSSEEDLENDDSSSEEDLDSDDGGREKTPLYQSNALEDDASHTEGDHGIKCNSVGAETEVSNDDAPKEDVGDDDEAWSLVSNDSAINASSVDQVKSLEDTSLTLENGGRGLNNMASFTETANNLLKPVNETLDVNGFKVLSSQVESVSHIFKRHPDIALGFRPKNQQIRKAYMNELLSLIETLCQSPEKLSEDDLSKAEESLGDLIDAGFALDWLKTKLKEVSEKKKKEQGSVFRIQTMEEQLEKLKLMFLDLETQLHKEKAEALASRAPLSFDDVVC